MSNPAGVSRKAEDAYPTGVPGPYSQFFSGVRVSHLLLILCMYYFSYLMFFVVYVSHVWSLSLDYFLLISARTLVPLVNLWPRLTAVRFTNLQKVTKPCYNNQIFISEIYLKTRRIGLNVWALTANFSLLEEFIIQHLSVNDSSKGWKQNNVRLINHAQNNLDLIICH